MYLSFKPDTGDNQTEAVDAVQARGGTLGISGWDVPLGPWNPQPIPELVQPNFATLY